MRKKPILITAAVVIALIILSLMLLLYQRQTLSDGSDTSSAPLVSQKALDKLPKLSGSTADTSHLAPSVIPPTNSWLSGMVLQKTPLPVYPMPLSFLAKDSGFEIGLPNISATATTINGGHINGLAATLERATSFQMTRSDKISATLTYQDNQKTDVGTMTIAEGVPYAYFRAKSDAHLTLSDTTSPTKDSSATYLRYSKANHDYITLATDGASIVTRAGSAEVTAPKGGLVTFYALPNQNKDVLRPYAGNEVRSVTTSHDTNDQSVTTKIHYDTTNNQPTVYAGLNYLQQKDSDQSLAAYESIYGSMTAVAGNNLITTAPMIKSSNHLDVSHITSEHKKALLATLKRDVASTKITAQDSYYAGKQLARAANLLDLAKQLNDGQSAATLLSILKPAMASRLGDQYFYYDSTLKGVAAKTKAFGSEDFNDHHFHYGYFIYAASILGKYDPQFLSDHADDINLLVADIASYDNTATFPVQRNYDAYTGHSWAAGLSPFADGNNQESSSEAMNAWNAVSLWGNLINNSRLTNEASWMLANEAVAARETWRSTPSGISGASNFSSPITSLNFSGKRTYSTFFSDEPNAKLGIQLLPMSPFMTALSGDEASISRLVKRSITDGNYNVALGDYILMYMSLHDPEYAQALLAKQQDAFIDDGNSRTYLNAFVFSGTDK